MGEDESYLLRPKDPLEIMQSQDRGALAQFLSDPYSAIAGAMIETFSHGPGAFTGSLVRVSMAALKGRALQQFANEIKDFQVKGKIAEDWAEKPKGYQTWVELMEVIDKEIPDEEQLDAMKAMFFAVNRINVADGERILAYQLFQIAKRLNSNDLLVIKTACEMDGRQVAVNQRGGWYGLISERLGHSVEDLVYLAEKALLEQQLLSQIGDLGQPPKPRVTLLGRRFCENIKQYQRDKKS